MAKKSMIAREVKRKKLVKKYAAKRKSLLDEFNAAKDPMERLEIHRKIQGLPRNSAPNRVRNRCWATGKPRGVHKVRGRGFFNIVHTVRTSMHPVLLGSRP